MKHLIDHQWDVKVCIDAKVLVDYPNDPAILINLSPVNKQKQIAIDSSTDTGSSTAKVVSLLDTMFGVDKSAKLLALVGGFYRNYYDFKGGKFKGVENSILSELAQSKLVVEAPALRLWGAKRKNLVSALTRTLMPILPGITGMPDKALKIVESTFRGQNPYNVKYKEIRGDELSKNLIKNIADSLGDPSLVIHLLGDFYILIPELSDQKEFELSEVVGSMVVYESMCKNCIYDLVLLSFNKTAIPQILSVYDEVADYIAEIIASHLDTLRRGEPAEVEEALERPDLAVDVLMYVNMLPSNKPVKVFVKDRSFTVLRELLRIGTKPENAYVSCEPDQTCPLQ
ncbi:MAG: hypothetical protein QW764_00555 [Desulfurococcaceae archaeon]